MIDPKHIYPVDIGRRVVYLPTKEVGVLTSANKWFVFVKFRGPDGEACNPADVEFENDGPGSTG